MKFAVLLLLAVSGLKAEPPKVVHRVELEYTKAALKAKLEGVVLLQATIGVDGIPTAITVTKPLGLGLDKKAVECLKKWRFSPATHHAEPVPSEVTVEMDFRIPLGTKGK
jgi:protein TonB